MDFIFKYVLQSFYIKFLFFQHNDLEETIKRIQNHKGVVGMMIVNQDGKHFNLQLE